MKFRDRKECATRRIPWGPVWACAGITFSVLLLTQMDLREGLLMLVTAGIAAANWWWTKHKSARGLGTPIL